MLLITSVQSLTLLLLFTPLLHYLLTLNFIILSFFLICSINFNFRGILEFDFISSRDAKKDENALAHKVPMTMKRLFSILQTCNLMTSGDRPEGKIIRISLDFRISKHCDVKLSVFITFSMLAILLACLGLFALTAYTMVRRTKEIGIRKVLGATIPDILSLVSKDFLKLVLIALLIAAPIAFYAVNKWLQDFSYKVNIQWWVFVVAGVITLLIAFITISLQAINTAMTNPVKNLRTE